MSSTIDPNEKKSEGLRNGKPGVGREKNSTPESREETTKKKQKSSPDRRKPAVQRRFGERKQLEFLQWMVQGASPQVACKKLNLPLADFWRTLERDAAFAAELQKVWDTLSFNVVAALYQAAIKGNGPAQQFWLKLRPAPQWAVDLAERTSPDDLENLTNEELLARLRQEAPDLAAEIAAGNRAARGGNAPQPLPPEPESAGA